MTLALVEPEVSADELTRAAAVMLHFAGLDANDLRLEPLPAGGNNRVFRAAAGGRSLLLKQYFHHESDTRDRLGAEFAFLQFAWSKGVRCVPRPIARQFVLRLGLYEFIDGGPVKAGDVDEQAVTAAADFVAAVNEHRGDPAATKLPAASDACFSLSDHLASVDRRLAQLHVLTPVDDVDEEAAAFVSATLVPAWEGARRELLAQAADAGWRMDEPLSSEQRVLSPSDFGFHNAIVAAAGCGGSGAASPNRLRFIDFEYAGWDDPAKLIADFFNQVAIPVPITFLNGFVQRLPAVHAGGGDVARRAVMLMPAYRVKWCCMSLGAFLPVTRDRRRFAGGEELGCRARALRKARGMLERNRSAGTDADSLQGC